MTEGNTKFVLHNDLAEDLTSFLTEYAQMQRVVRNHEKAKQAELIRNNLYAQDPNMV